jgi:hypothetical protein
LIRQRIAALADDALELGLSARAAACLKATRHGDDGECVAALEGLIEGCVSVTKYCELAGDKDGVRLFGDLRTRADGCRVTLLERVHHGNDTRDVR